MSHMSTAVGSGIVLGIVLVFLLQQFGLLALTSLFPTVVYFVAAVVIGALAFGLPVRAARR